jgi:hypothetical protein
MALSDDDRAALSAYLDGELDDDATHRIEVRLTSEPELRFEYETLRQTWSLLDFLPRSSPSVDFTNRTLSRITIERNTGGPTWVSVLARRVPVLTIACAAAVMLAAGVGVATGTWLAAPPDAGLEEGARSDAAWMRKQPLAERMKFDGLPAKEKHEFVLALRKKEQERHDEWTVAARLWDRMDAAPRPNRFEELDARDQQSVKEYLLPFLSPAEKEQLKQSEGHWTRYAPTLVGLCDQHPLALPSAFGPSKVDELPQALRKHFASAKHANVTNFNLIALLEKRTKDQKWPTMAEAVVLFRKGYLAKQPFEHELWAYNFECLWPPMQAYVVELKKKLTQEDKSRFSAANDNWPDYPMAIKAFAEKYNLSTPPWETALSDPRWDVAYRTTKVNAGPAVPPQVLDEFVKGKLTQAERAKLRFSLHDPQSLKRAEALFHEMARQHPMSMKKFGSHFQGRERKSPRD